MHKFFCWQGAFFVVFNNNSTLKSFLNESICGEVLCKLYLGRKKSLEDLQVFLLFQKKNKSRLDLN